MLIRRVLDPEGRQVVQEEQLLVARSGRIRGVQVGPDGQLWLLTDENPGALWRIGPVA